MLTIGKCRSDVCTQWLKVRVSLPEAGPDKSESWPCTVQFQYDRWAETAKKNFVS